MTTRRVSESESLDARVDRETYTIRGVKICGLESRNPGSFLGIDSRENPDAARQPYRYSERALRDAIPRYEGTAFVDHPPMAFASDGTRHATAEHGSESVIGHLQNVRYESGRGLIGDLVLLKSHPLSARLLEAADRNPRLYSLSHEATFGDVQIVDGRATIMNITSVSGVAIVPRGATSGGLFESADSAKPDTSEPDYSKHGSMADAMRRGKRTQDDGPSVADEMRRRAKDAMGHVAGFGWWDRGWRF